jgi:hypothetical protein
MAICCQKVQMAACSLRQASLHQLASMHRFSPSLSAVSPQLTSARVENKFTCPSLKKPVKKPGRLPALSPFQAAGLDNGLGTASMCGAIKP